MHSTATSGMSMPVSMITAISGSLPRAQLRNSTPFMRGSSMSRRQSSNCSELSQVSASSAEAAVRTEYPKRVRSRFRLLRTSTSSSTTRIRAFSGARRTTSFQLSLLIDTFLVVGARAAADLPLGVWFALQERKTCRARGHVGPPHVPSRIRTDWRRTLPAHRHGLTLAPPSTPPQHPDDP